MKILATIGIAVTFLAGCKVPDEDALLLKATSQVQYAKGSRIQYAAVPAGTVFQQTAIMGSTNATTLEDQGIVLFIDEQPEHDWAHSFQLVFVPKTTGIPQNLFHGSAIPGFSFKQPDGRMITKWKER